MLQSKQAKKQTRKIIKKPDPLLGRSPAKQEGAKKKNNLFINF
jgi:hypothetical protein